MRSSSCVRSSSSSSSAANAAGVATAGIGGGEGGRGLHKANADKSTTYQEISSATIRNGQRHRVRKGKVLGSRWRTRKNQVDKPLLSVLGLTQADCRTSRPTTANVSFSSRHTITTHEHVDSTPPATCLQLAGRSGAQGYPGSPNSLIPRSVISENPGIDITSSKEASWDRLKPGPLRDLRVKATRLGSSSGRCSASFTRPSSTCGVMLAPATPTRGGASTIFSRVGAPDADPSS
jgi:hypothetical protein